MRIRHWLIVIVALLVMQGCIVAPAPPHGYGPREHDRGYGHRNMYRYYYYPDARVYFDLDRRLYFYLDDGWRRSERLPRSLHVHLNGPVTLEMDLDEPYRRYREHSREYPPGYYKHKKKYKSW